MSCTEWLYSNFTSSITSHVFLLHRGYLTHFASFLPEGEGTGGLSLYPEPLKADRWELISTKVRPHHETEAEPLELALPA